MSFCVGSFYPLNYDVESVTPHPQPPIYDAVGTGHNSVNVLGTIHQDVPEGYVNGRRHWSSKDF